MTVPGNKFWLARSSHGRAPKFKKPDDLMNACMEYFEWVNANPLYEDRIVSFQGMTTHEPVAKMRAMTIGGLCLFLDISRVCWMDYSRKKDFSKITQKVEDAIREQKFIGAAADLLNANIISRDLGLADRQEHSGIDGGPIENVTRNLSLEDAAELYASTLNATFRKPKFKSKTEK